MIDLDGALDLLSRSAAAFVDGGTPGAERGVLGAERVALGEAVGRVLAEDVRAQVPAPLHDYSAMDGYAVATADFVGAGPFELPIVGESRTGHANEGFHLGTAMRIFTGSALPEGANAVIMQENVRVEGQRLHAPLAPKPGANVRRAGEDLQAGDVALAKGTRISSFQLGLLASVERTEVLVARRPRVAILCTGDELRPPGLPGGPGLAESNGPAVAALVEVAGGIAVRAPIVPDEPGATRAAIAQAAACSDVVVTVGGASVGDHDWVRPALAELGGEVIFSKVAIRPGKPVLLARLGQSWVLGLPGNPGSAQITFALFGVRLLRLLQGDRRAVPTRRTARLLEPLRRPQDRTWIAWAELVGEEARVLRNQSSGASTASAESNGFVLVAPGAGELEVGTRVDVILHAEL